MYHLEIAKLSLSSPYVADRPFTPPLHQHAFSYLVLKFLLDFKHNNSLHNKKQSADS